MHSHAHVERLPSHRRVLAAAGVLIGGLMAGEIAAGVVAGGGVAVTLAARAVLAGASRESLNVRGVFLHVATDLAAFGGTAVAGALVLATGWDRFDPIAGLLVAALVFR